MYMYSRTQAESVHTSHYIINVDVRLTNKQHNNNYQIIIDLEELRWYVRPKTLMTYRSGEQTNITADTMEKQK